MENKYNSTQTHRMKPALLLTVLLFTILPNLFAQQQDTVTSIGESEKILTLTKGQYNETFDADSIQQIGTSLINIHTMKVVKLLKDKESKQRLEGETHSRFLSIDPFSAKYPMLTPYQFASNRPIDGIDLDGLEYYSAANWAESNIADYTIRFNYDYDFPPGYYAPKFTT